MRGICCAGLVAGLLAVAAPAALADLATPANCTFSNGVTVCSTTTSSTATVTSTDGNGCTVSTPVTTTVTTYTAHHGAPNSHGEQITAPPPETTVTDGTPSTPDCSQTSIGTGSTAGSG
jgi:hypothetical protein